VTIFKVELDKDFPPLVIILTNPDHISIIP
jgi:hypothetical protein